MLASDSADGKHVHPPHISSSFCFKIEDRKGRMHRFSCGQCSLLFPVFVFPDDA